MHVLHVTTKQLVLLHQGLRIGNEDTSLQEFGTEEEIHKLAVMLNDMLKSSAKFSQSRPKRKKT